MADYVCQDILGTRLCCDGDMIINRARAMHSEMKHRTIKSKYNQSCAHGYHSRMQTCHRVHVHVCTRAHMHTRVRVCAYRHLRVRSCACVRVRVWVCVHMWLSHQLLHKLLLLLRRSGQPSILK